METTAREQTEQVAPERETGIAEEGEDVRQDEDLTSSVLTLSDTIDEPLTLYGLTTAPKRRRKGKLPGPLKLPKWFRPKLLTPQQEQVLVQRLCKVPERWHENYGEDIKKKRLCKTKTASPAQVNKTVERLSKPVDRDNGTEKSEQKHDDYDDVFWMDREEKIREWKLSKYELERMIERLSRASIRNEAPSVSPYVNKTALTTSGMQRLIDRLNKPKSYAESDVLPRLQSTKARFVGNRRLKSAEMEKMVERIAYKGIKMVTDDERRRRLERNEWSSWTTQDSDYQQWRKYSHRLDYEN